MLSNDLINLNEKYTLSEIVNKLRSYFSTDDFGSLNMFHRTFMMTFIFLSEIWDRILENAERDRKYWDIYVNLYQPGAVEREPTADEVEILKTWRKHKFRLNLDVEDWYIHSYILMDKFARFVRRLIQLISKTPEERKLSNRIPFKNFDSHRKFYLNKNKQHLVTDKKYAEIINKNTKWYIKELKNIRDDLIQHPNVPKFWSYEVTENRIILGRFRHNEKHLISLCEIRDNYASVYPEIEGETNFLALLSFFEKMIDNLQESEIQKVKDIRKSFGADFPDISKLFSKMSEFFSLVNDHFVHEIQGRFE